jgi:16S rRNA (cytosine967-C5)-methyltransferase
MSDARRRAVEALIPAAETFPELDPGGWSFGGLPPRDAALALAIHRTVMQRWITLVHLLDRCLSQKMFKLEARLRAVLLAGAAQAMFLDRMPDHAVVDESVELARKVVRPGAAGLVNAVLRKLIAMRGEVESQAWSPASDLLPVEGGRLRLRAEVLPPTTPLAQHLAAATSHPRRLVQRWIDVYGEDVAVDLCLHGTLNPPTIVFDGDAHRPWTGTHEELVAWLAESPTRRVQDPASSEPVRGTRGLTVKRALDYCAGRGTKTRQLALLHPDAEIVATDVDADRFAALRETFAGHERVRVVEPWDALREAAAVDLLLLDVPCSNTGVLARRPEARYRFSQSSLDKLVSLQRGIADQTVPLLRGGACVLYATCSLEREENQKQAAWIADRHGLRVEREGAVMPSRRDEAYHDGSYHALLVR